MKLFSNITNITNISKLKKIIIMIMAALNNILILLVKCIVIYVIQYHHISIKINLAFGNISAYYMVHINSPIYYRFFCQFFLDIFPSNSDFEIFVDFLNCDVFQFLRISNVLNFQSFFSLDLNKILIQFNQFKI